MNAPVAGPSTAATTATSEPASLPEDPNARPQGMSKNAMKKAARQAKLEALKPLKRAAEKERRRARAAQLAEGYANGTLSEGDKEIFERRKKMEKERRVAKRKIEHGEGEDWMGGVVIDLGFDELMNEQEINSTSSQLGYVYSSNRTARKPINTVIHTTFSPSASPRLWERMSSSNWHKWSRSHWWSEGLAELASALQTDPTSTPQSHAEAGDAQTEATKALDPTAGPSAKLEAHLTGPALPPGLNKGTHKLVYLSADAEEELSTLSEDEVYIIGGIVDRNRYKNLCQDKAEKLGIRTARLPIGTFIANLPTRKVLTVNQVFDILVQYIALGDWKAAFETVIPQRKYHESKKAKRAHAAGARAGSEAAPGVLPEEDEEGDVSITDQEEAKPVGQGDKVVIDEEESMMNQ